MTNPGLTRPLQAAQSISRKNNNNSSSATCPSPTPSFDARKLRNGNYLKNLLNSCLHLRFFMKKHLLFRLYRIIHVEYELFVRLLHFYQLKHCNCPEFEWLLWQLFLWETNVCLKDLQRISIIWMTSKYPQEAKEKVASNFYAIVVTLSCLKDNWWVLHWGLNTCPNFFFCKKSPEWFCSIFTNKFLSICWQTTWIEEMKKMDGKVNMAKITKIWLDNWQYQRVVLFVTIEFDIFSILIHQLNFFVEWK